MSKLSAIIKLNKTQYNTLKAGGTVGTYTWDDNALYIVEDSTEYVPTTRTINELPLSNNIVLTGRNINYDTASTDTIYDAVTEKTKYAGQLIDQNPNVTAYPLQYNSMQNDSDAISKVSNEGALLSVVGPGSGYTNYIKLARGVPYKKLTFKSSASGTSLSELQVTPTSGTVGSLSTKAVFFNETFKDGDHIMLFFRGKNPSSVSTDGLGPAYQSCVIEGYFKYISPTNVLCFHQVGGKCNPSLISSGDFTLTVTLNGSYYSYSGASTKSIGIRCELTKVPSSFTNMACYLYEVRKLSY